ncbi:MAG: DNA/RNA nuclease SfsA [Muricoprocola sp.]
MIYENCVHGIFESRSNRFIARVWVEGVLETVHVKNTGRLGELLLKGTEVVLQKASDPKRKTKYDLVSVYREKLGWVNIDSQVPNKLVLEWLKKQDFTFIKPEYSYGDSRLDFYMEKGNEKYLMEVKGCTLEMEGKGWFPDAVSTRAKRHELELASAVKQGYHCITAFVIAMNGVREVCPNEKKDPEFAKAYQFARQQGVQTWYFACEVTDHTIEVQSVIK